MAPNSNVLLLKLQARLAYPLIKQLPLGRLPAPYPRMYAWSTSISISSQCVLGTEIAVLAYLGVSAPVWSSLTERRAGVTVLMAWTARRGAPKSAA